MRFKYKIFISGILSILTIYIVFMTCIDVIAFNRSFFNAQYSRLNTAEEIGMSKDDLYVASDILLDYIKNYRDNINVKVEISGDNREVFDKREKDHMVDVKNLYLNAMFIRNVCIGVVVLLLLLLCYDNKKEVKGALTYAYIRICTLFLFLLSALGIYAVSDFNAFWTQFHKVFFQNDLWLLDPNTSIMIQMFPENFFFVLVIAIASGFFGILFILLIYSIYKQKELIRTTK